MIILALGIWLCPFTSPAAEVAVFLSGDRGAYRVALEGVRETIAGTELTELNMKEDSELGRQMVEKLREMNPKVVLAIGARAAKLVAEEIQTVPVVYCFVFNPFGYGLTGKNVTGVAVIASPRSQLRGFREVLPSLRRLGVLFNPEKSLALVERGRKAASRLGIELVSREISSPEEISSALKGIISEIDALWLVPDTTVVTREIFTYILRTTVEHQRPIFAFSEGLVRSGALMSLSPGHLETGKEAGKQIRMILEGKKPEQIPMVYPPGRMYVNSNVAETLRIRIPKVIRQKAEKIF
jgi:putative ABC transport system substrate-binding protein